MTFHKGFFPTRLEGKLSSVTEVKLKEGNLQEHQRTLTLDMPAASATLEGPIIRNKMSYVVSLRRSWLDFFDSLLWKRNASTMPRTTIRPKWCTTPARAVRCNC